MSTTKLASLLVRTISKPIANSIKNYSKSHPTFRQMCINVAQATRRFEIKLNMNLLGQKTEKIRPLNDAKAVEMGANFLGEAIIFGVASSLIIWEQARSYKSSKDRQYKLDDKIEMLKEEISKLKALIEINREFEDQMMNQIEKLKNDNEKLQNLLDLILTKGLGPRRLQSLNIPKIQWESKNDDNKNLQEQEKIDRGP
ncbi:hypothetical protein RclHR1_12040006 [Rhizophagus clarus]|uniref:OPA3-like protein n=1 Tax=Rhizophagus clarus TaxID=94130 RepID=A0A2Z6QL67_9GLOM|nr:hypothetical protein RclHR1_12040004 [Rhizophagus clarus]GBB85554.1 hypothetical protein RclHR1_12040006 [Rhizophagus clarus]